MNLMPYGDIQDSKYFQVTPEDPAMRVDIEGGYEITRPRHTRTPRRTYESGFTNLTNAQKVTLETFWDTVAGGSVIFEWTHPITTNEIQVRFTKPLSFKYVGRGGNHLWDVGFEVRES